MKKILFVPLDFENPERAEIIKNNVLTLVYMINSDKTVFLTNKSHYPLIMDIRIKYSEFFNDKLNFDLVNIEHLYDLPYVINRFVYKIEEYINENVIIDCTYSTDIMNLASILVADRYNKVIQKNMFPVDISQSKYSSKKNFDTLNLMYLFNHYSFSIMKEIINNKNSLDSNTKKLYGNLAEDYHNWDNFNYAAISNRQYNLDFKDYSEHFLENYRGLQKIIDFDDKRHYHYQIADLLNNADRRAFEGKYNDAVMRLYKTLDLVAHAQLELRYGINKVDIDVKQLSKLGIKRKHISKLENQHRSRTTNKEIELNLTEGYFLLHRLGDKIGRHYYKNIELFTRLNRIRNKSILNHGKNSLTLENYMEFESVALDIANMFSSDIERYMKELKFPRFKIKDNDKHYFK